MDRFADEARSLGHRCGLRTQLMCCGFTAPSAFFLSARSRASHPIWCVELTMRYRWAREVLDDANPCPAPIRGSQRTACD